MLFVLAGCVGEAAATEYIAWLAATGLYDPEAVLSSQKIVDWTSRPDRIFGLTMAIVAIAQTRGDKKTWSRALAALTACASAGRPDLAYPGARILMQKVPDGAVVPQASIKAFSRLMSRSGKWAVA